MKRITAYTDTLDWYTPEQLTEILGCTKTTAYRYGKKQSIPRPAELRLLQLMVDGRIMPDDWPSTMKFHGRHLHTGVGQLTWAQAEQAEWLMSQWYQTVNFLEKLQHRLTAISKKLSLEELMAVEPIQEEINERLKTNKDPDRFYKHKQQWKRKDGC